MLGSTNRPTLRDTGEIEATKNAGRLGLPIFVITYPSLHSDRRNVYLAWVTDWDDESQLFLISFSEPLYRAFSGYCLSDISPALVRCYVRRRYADGVAASTINKEIGLLSAAFTYANREWGWDITNPAAGCRQTEPEGRLRWLTKAEATGLLRAASHRDLRAPHLHDFIQLALNTGCRKGELLKLEWCRVDLQRDMLWLEGEHTKAGRRRGVPLNASSRAALLRRASFRAKHCPASPWVYCNKEGNRIKDVRRSFGTACKRAGLEDFRIHDLRNTFAACPFG